MTDRLIERLSDYRDHAHTAFPVPDVAELGSHPLRRRRRRLRGVFGAAVATLLVGLAAVAVRAPSLLPAEPPAPVATTIETVDWTNTELIVPENPDNPCPDGRVRLYPRTFDDVGRIGISSPDPRPGFETLQTAGPVTYGDLTGDGRPEAVLAIRCSREPGGFSEQENRQLLVVQMLPDHTLQGLQFVGTVHANYPSFHVDDELLYVQLRYNHAAEGSYGGNFWDTAFTQVFQWNGASFRQIAGRTAPLNFTGSHDGYGVVTQLAEILSPTGEVLCPAAPVPFAFAPFTVDGFVYDLSTDIGRHGGAEKVDVDADGNEELVVGVRCTGPGYDAVSIYVLTQETNRFAAMDVIANDGTWTLRDFEASSTQLTLTTEDLTGGLTQVHTLTWTGERFEPSVGGYRLVP